MNTAHSRGESSMWGSDTAVSRRNSSVVSAGEMDILACKKITAPMDAPQVVEVPVIVTKSGSRQVDLRERRHNTSDAAYFMEGQRSKEGNGNAQS